MNYWHLSGLKLFHNVRIFDVPCYSEAQRKAASAIPLILPHPASCKPSQRLAANHMARCVRGLSLAPKKLLVRSRAPPSTWTEDV